MDITQKIKNAPSGSGVYIFKGASGAVLYVGKAVSIKKRLRNYIRPQSPRQSKLLRDSKKLEFMETQTPQEALIREANLIKEARPRYNVAFRDDKTYPYIKITYQEEFPRILTTRVYKSDGSLWFGPYANVRMIKKALKFIRGVFPYRTCSKMPRKACLFYTLSLCPGPCIGKVKKEEYRRMIKNIILFLEGRQDKLVESLARGMRSCAQRREFEKAALLREEIALLSGVGEKGGKSALGELARVLKMKHPPRIIEGFDVSNISGRDAVGSVVLFRAGVPERSGYRRFKIKFIHRIDDYRMIKEIVLRRYCRLLKEKPKGLPDLIVIDGGRGHLSAARGGLRELGLDKVPVISIAKREEEIFIPGVSAPIRLDKKSTALNLIRSIRDEAHRFAIEYHRLRRRKRGRESTLDEIPGIGPRRRQDLLRQFGSVERIGHASADELAMVPGITDRLAEEIVAYFAKKG